VSKAGLSLFFGLPQLTGNTGGEQLGVLWGEPPKLVVTQDLRKLSLAGVTKTAM
jgi:hypothetical protein